ncbi:MAG: Uncharacterized protein G01um10147_740 [Microgenomates group bacterium Gr01-1014_7]|nr:MAG: Uncharacterized protein G01um10147_740 [Microgenomates group bacterium Gr01-1014_7]
MVAYLDMFPVLFSLGNLSVSSFGVFLALGFLLGIFLIWRLARAWDLDEEKVLDLTLLTLIGGLIGARIYFVLENFQFFSQHLFGILVIYKYPGFSFWGGIIGGVLTLYFLVRKKKDNFLQALDIASVGVVGALVLSDLGCFLGGCGVGAPNNLFFSVNMVGVLGKRFPVQVLEALLFLFALSRLWSSATHFHQRGKILSLSLIYFGAVKLLTSPLRAQNEFLLFFVFLFCGVYIFYKVTKRKLISDLKNLPKEVTMERLKKYWYNQKTALVWNLRNLKKILRRFNVRLSWKKSRQY